MPLGLSPLTRGNRAEAGAQAGAEGPIPAHAGQPPADAAPTAETGTYPRSRGATALGKDGALEAQGLSPLTRGNQGDVVVAAVLQGPIPAHAGQPSLMAEAMALPRAYPRSRGATAFSVTE